MSTEQLTLAAAHPFWQFVDQTDGPAACWPFAVGPANPHSKIAEADVVAIRQMAAGGTQHWRIAQAFGLTRGHISKIVRNEFWRHVDVR